MTSLLDRLLSVPPFWVYAVVTTLVFLEDAVFVGFVVPGETAAVLGGVAASLGHVSLVAIATLVVVAAVAGDSVGYEVGRHAGPRLLETRLLRRHASRLDGARGFLARRGGSAVLLARFVAFLRAVMPAMCGLSRMPYRRFLAWNVGGGVLWGTAFVLLGYAAGASYQHVERLVGRGLAGVVLAVAFVALLVWRFRRRRTRRGGREATADPVAETCRGSLR